MDTATQDRILNVPLYISHGTYTIWERYERHIKIVDLILGQREGKLTFEKPR